MKSIPMEYISIKGMVSIVVPIYNAENFLRNSVSSIINQSYSNIELLLIDDGSIDMSGQLCDEYASGDRRIKVIHKKNGGPSEARNLGIAHSLGEFIFFIDADDILQQDAIRLLVDAQLKTRADIVVGDYRKIGSVSGSSGFAQLFVGNILMEKNEVIAHARMYLSKPNKPSLLGYSWGRLFKAAIIKDNGIKFNIELHTFEDVCFNFEYLKYTNKLYFLSEVIYNYTIHNSYSSATMTFKGDPLRLFGYQRALVCAGNYLRRHNFSNPVIDKEIGHAYVVLSIIQLVRMCGQFGRNNWRKIFEAVSGLVKSRELRMYLKFYVPTAGDSRILPVLMKFQTVWPIILVCWYKSYKRYRRVRFAH